MAKTQTDFYAKTTRSMLACVKEVGAMPFILFEYYLTWETASGGIRPSLQTVADDLGLEKNAVCNLRSRLIKAGWIRYENEQVFIVKSFTKNESKTENHSQKMNDDSQKMNERSQKMNERSQKMNGTEIAIIGISKRELTKNKQEEGERENRTPRIEKSVDEILELEQQINEKENAYFQQPKQTTKAIEIYQSFFPTNFLNDRQLLSFAERLPDAEFNQQLWQRTLKDWIDAGYRSSNFVGMVDKYFKDKQRSMPIAQKQSNLDERGFYKL